MKNDQLNERGLNRQLALELGSYSFDDIISITLPHACYNKYPYATYAHETVHKDLVTSTPYGMLQRLIYLISKESELPPGAKKSLEGLFSHTVVESFRVQEGIANYAALNSLRGIITKGDVVDIYNKRLPTLYRNAVADIEKVFPDILEEPPLKSPFYSFAPICLGKVLLSSPVLESFPDFGTLLEPTAYSEISKHSPDHRLSELIKSFDKRAFLKALYEETQSEILKVLSEHGINNSELLNMDYSDKIGKMLLTTSRLMQASVSKLVGRFVPTLPIMENRQEAITRLNALLTSAKDYFKAEFSINILGTMTHIRESEHWRRGIPEDATLKFKSVSHIPYKVIGQEEFNTIISGLAKWKSDVVIVLMHNPEGSPSSMQLIKGGLTLEPGGSALGIICLPDIGLLKEDQAEVFKKCSYNIVHIKRAHLQEKIQSIRKDVPSVSWMIYDFDFFELIKEKRNYLMDVEDRIYIIMNIVNQEYLAYVLSFMQQIDENIICWASKKEMTLFLIIQGCKSKLIWLTPAFPTHFGFVEQQCKGNKNVRCHFKREEINLVLIPEGYLTLKIINSHYN